MAMSSFRKGRPFTVGAGGVVQRERAQFRMQLAHSLHDAEILDIEGLDHGADAVGKKKCYYIRAAHDDTK